MGTSASLQKETRSSNNSNGVTAQNLRQRLHNDYYDEALLDQNEERSAPLGIAEVPALLKAKSNFMKSIRKGKESSGKGSNIVKKQDNHGLLKEMFNRMDPTVASGSYGRILGEIEVSLKYKSNESTLLVKIGRAKGLHPPDDHKLPDPFVKASLVIKRLGEGAAQVHRTRPKSKTLNPLFQEILTFDLLQADLVEAKLIIDVWNKDIISKDDFLGEAILELYKEEVNGGLPVWRKLNPKIDLDITGSIEVSMACDENLLVVTIHQASNLKAIDKTSNSSNPYVRCYVTGVPNKEETEVIMENLNPVFEETFEYEVESEIFNGSMLVLNVLSKDVSGKDARLGDVQIPLSDINLRNPEKAWYDLADLRNNPHSRSKFSEVGVSQEFKEAMRAHAIYQYPHCLFQGKHSGRKLIAVTCSKAGSSAKMTIVNGFPIHE